MTGRKIAMIGTRGVPAAYGGFETAVEEIGARLASQHSVTVYCRSDDDRRPEYRGMKLVHLPAIRQKQLETISHTALSVFHAMTAKRPDVAFVFNAANAPLAIFLRLLRIPTVIHVDGLEWRRSKWGRIGRRYYRFCEWVAVRTGTALIADAQGIADYYAEKFGAPTELLAYGAPILTETAANRVTECGVEPGAYHVLVARMEPENHVAELVEGYVASDAKNPLVVVGSAPYADAYLKQVNELAARDDRVRMVGAIWDAELLNALYANSITYLHGQSVGGTNPSLLRAMGAGAATIAWDVSFNREVLAEQGWFVDSPAAVATAIAAAESDPVRRTQFSQAGVARVQTHYNWDQVAKGYGQLAEKLARPLKPLANNGGQD